MAPDVTLFGYVIQDPLAIEVGAASHELRRTLMTLGTSARMAGPDTWTTALEPCHAAAVRFASSVRAAGCGRSALGPKIRSMVDAAFENDVDSERVRAAVAGAILARVEAPAQLDS